MAAEYIDSSFEKLKRDIQGTHEAWDDFIWHFIYSEGIAEIEKAAPTLIENMNEAEKSLRNLLNEISSL
jgi:hypothetical protein